MDLALLLANVAVAIGTMALAYATFLVVRTARQQMEVSRLQASVSRSQIFEQYRPLLEPRSTFKDGYPFVVRNVGTGVAFNVRFLLSSESDLSGPDTGIDSLHVSIAPGEFAEHSLFERQPQLGTQLIISCDDLWGQEHVAHFAYDGGNQAWRRLARVTDGLEVAE